MFLIIFLKKANYYYYYFIKFNASFLFFFYISLVKIVLLTKKVFETLTKLNFWFYQACLVSVSRFSWKISAGLCYPMQYCSLPLFTMLNQPCFLYVHGQLAILFLNFAAFVLGMKDIENEVMKDIPLYRSLAI